MSELDLTPLSTWARLARLDQARRERSRALAWAALACAAVALIVALCVWVAKGRAGL